MIKLRDYQSNSVNEIFRKWKMHNNLILWSATGSGKTEIASYIAQECLKDGMPCLMIVRGRELVKNMSERLSKYKIDHSVYMAGHYKFDAKKTIQICSIDTMISRNVWPYKDTQAVLILDEAHKDYSKIFEIYKTQFKLGLTGTPFSNVSMYDDYVKVIEPFELRDIGILTPEKIYCPHVVDTSSLKIVAGDFKRNEVEQLVTNGEIVGNVVQDYIDLGEGRPSVCFAVSIEHSKQLRDQFIRRGISSVHCDASSKDEERKKAKEDLENGKIKVLCNVDIFSVGWDCPMVSCIILARPTWSLIWYLQAIGRGLRSFSGKSDCIVLDNAGNVFRHGSPYRIREIDLDGSTKKKKKYDLDESIRTCQECYFVYESSLINCPECGAEPPKREIKKIEGKLKLYTETEDQRSERIKKEAQSSFYRLLWVAKSRKLSSNWIRHEIEKKYGKEVMPIIEKLIQLNKFS